MCITWSPGAFFAVAFLLPGLWQLARQGIALRWRPTTGLVEDHVVRRRLGPEDHAFYEASPTYSYQVDGRTLRGDRLSYADTSEGTTREDALSKMRARYPAQSEVVVYYDPGNPERAVLERDINYLRPLISLVTAGIFATASKMFSC
jgi:hypothetical protein